MCIPLRSNINVYNYIDENDVEYVHSTYSLSINFEKNAICLISECAKKVYYIDQKLFLYIFYVVFEQFLLDGCNYLSISVNIIGPVVSDR